MPIDKWPFYPDCLTDVLSEDLVSFVEIAMGHILDTGVAIIEFTKGEFHCIRPESSLELESWANFCKLLRNRHPQPIDIKGGEDACRKCDIIAATKLLEKTKTVQSSDQHIPSDIYHCHMKLIDIAYPVYINNFPVAVFFAGQFLPQEENALENIYERINNIEMPPTQDFPLIIASPEAKEKLKNEAQYLKKWNRDFINKIEEAVKRISHIAQIQYNLIRYRKIHEFMSSLYEHMLNEQRTQRALKEWLCQLLEKVRIFLNVECVALFGQEEEKGTVLDLVAYSGIPEKYKDLYLHFNWRKAELPNTKEEMEKIPWLLSKQILQKGLKSKLENNITLSYFIESPVWIPYIHSSGDKTLLCLTGLPKECILNDEQEFLKEISHIVGQRFVYRSDYIRRLDMERDAESIANLIAHQVRASLTPIRSGAETASLCLDGRDEKQNKAKTILSHLDAFIFDLAEHGKMTLEALRTKVNYTYRYSEDQFQEMDLGKLVTELSENYKARAAQRKMTISVNPRTEAPPLVPVVPEAIHTVFANLFDNALKYSQPNTNISIEFRYNDPLPYTADKILIDFISVGRIIDSDETERIFERGEQGRHANNMEGSGLGLWECREILRAHRNGTIKVSAYPGKTPDFCKVTFTIQLTIPKRSTKK